MPSSKVCNEVADRLTRPPGRAQHARHRRQQTRGRRRGRMQLTAGHCFCRNPSIQSISGPSMQHLAENVGDAGNQDAEDHAIDRRDCP